MALVEEVLRTWSGVESRTVPEAVVVVVSPQVSPLLKVRMEKREVSRGLEMGSDISSEVSSQPRSAADFPIGRPAPWEGKEPLG